MNFKGSKYLSAILLLAIVFALSVTGYAAASVDLQCSIGYGDSITYLRKLPVNVSITNQGADVSGVIAVDINRSKKEFDRYEMPVTIASGATVNVSLPVLLTQMQRTFVVQWLVDDVVMQETEVRAQTTIHPASLIIGAVSIDSGTLNSLNITTSSDPLKRGELWHVANLTLNSFPSDQDSMRFFDIIAVDGVDLTLLNKKQQETLHTWMMDGGIVILGGGAQANTSFPYFHDYTGISAGELIESSEITETLMSQLDITEKANITSLMRVSLDGATGSALGSPSLIDVTKVGNGSILTSAFSISEKTFTKWQAKSALWQRILLEYIQTAYSNIISNRSSTYSNNDNYVSTSNIGVPNSKSTYLPIVVFVIFVLMVGLGSYFLLKKVDKREWMWVTIPTLCILASLVMWALSSTLGLNDPIAVTSTVLSIDREGRTQAYTNATVTKADAGRIEVAIDKGSIDLAATTSYNYYPDDSFTGNENTSELRYLTRYGEKEAASLPIHSAWQSINLGLMDIPTAECQITSICRWNGDALEFKLTNNGTFPLDAGVILTTYGYVTVDALLPGQTITANLIPLPDATSADNMTSTVTADPSVVITTPPTGNAVKEEDLIKDGYLISDKLQSNNPMYSIYADYTNQLMKKSKDTEQSNLVDAQIHLVYSCMNKWGQYNDVFHYLVPSNELTNIKLHVDGKQVTRTNHVDMLDVEIPYSYISTDGTARFMKGDFDVYLATLNDDKAPQLGAAIPMKGYSYYSLLNTPTFAFDMSVAPDNYEISAFDITTTNSYSSHKISLYNITTGKWDEFKEFTYSNSTGLSTGKSTLPKLDQYLNEQKLLYVKFEAVGSQNNYAEIGIPILTMDGKVK